jgi:hypothetical protein
MICPFPTGPKEQRAEGILGETACALQVRDDSQRYADSLENVTELFKFTRDQDERHDGPSVPNC